MVKEIHVEGLDAYQKAVAENEGKTIFALFSGSTDADGNNWCPDCVSGIVTLISIANGDLALSSSSETVL